MLDEVLKFINDQRSEYIVDWENGNAERFEADGHYKWMSKFIAGRKRVLEIGTGDGRATLELIKQGHVVYSIDENSACLDAAQSRLEENNVTVCRVKRERISLAENKKYKIAYDDITLNTDENVDVYLFESDILNDPGLVKWLETQQKFNAVICWLIGTNAARIFNEAINIDEMPTPSHYRIFVQNAVYELADVVLEKDGILHIVDRGKELNEVEAEESIDSHVDQASVTSIEVQQSMCSIEYKDPDNGYDVGMVTSVGNNYTREIPGRKYLHSYIGIKK